MGVAILSSHTVFQGTAHARCTVLLSPGVQWLGVLQQSQLRICADYDGFMGMGPQCGCTSAQNFICA